MTQEEGRNDVVEAPEGAEPEPVKDAEARKWLKSIGTSGLIIGGTLLTFGVLCTSSTSGATRSAKLKVEERQQLIQEARQAALDEAHVSSQ